MHRLTIAAIAASASLLSDAVALCSRAVAQTPPVDGTSVAASATDAAQQLETYLDKVFKGHSRPDLTKPPASDLLSRIFDFDKLATLPAPDARDFPSLVAWAEAANQAARAVFFFGFTPPANLNEPLSDANRAALERNNDEFEDQEVLADTFIVHISAREAQSLFLLDRLKQLENVKTRTDLSGAVSNALLLLTVDNKLKPANERLLSAALADTADVWVKALVPRDLPYLTLQVAKAQSKVNDAEAKKNLAVFSAAMAAACAKGAVSRC